MTGTRETYACDATSDTIWERLLDSYCKYEERHRRLLRWRALGYAGLIYSASIFVFLLSSASHYHHYWFAASMAGFFVAFPLTLLCHLSLRRIVRYRRNISHELFNAGLRVDEEHYLLTNTAHPRLIAKSQRAESHQ